MPYFFLALFLRLKWCFIYKYPCYPISIDVDLTLSMGYWVTQMSDAKMEEHLVLNTVY